MLISAYGTTNAISAFNAYVQVEQQAVLSAVARLAQGCGHIDEFKMGYEDIRSV